MALKVFVVLYPRNKLLKTADLYYFRPVYLFKKIYFLFRHICKNIALVVFLICICVSWLGNTIVCSNAVQYSV